MSYISLPKLVLLLAVIASLAACGGAEQRKAVYMEKGRAYLQENNLEKAKLEFKNVLQIDPKFAEAHYYMSRVYEKLGQYSRAFGSYRKTLELSPEHHDAMIGMAKIYLLAGDVKNAGDYADRILQKTPGDADALVVRAGVRFRAAETEAALKDIRDALARQPDHQNGLALLAHIYNSLGQQQKAEALLLAATQRSPQKLDLQLLLIQQYVAGKQYQQAIPLLQGLVMKDSQNLEFRTKLAALYHLQGDKDAAENILRNAVRDLPDDVRPKRALVRYLSENRDLMIAQVELSAYIKNDPGNAELKMMSAGIFEKTRDFDRAESIYRDIIEQNSSEPDVNRARFQLARLLLDMQRIDESRQQLAALLKDNPGDIDGLSLRGRYALNDGDAASAIADFRSILKQQPDAEAIVRLLAQAYLSTGQLELAQQQLMEAVKRHPQDLEARLQLAKIYQQQGQYSDVVEQARSVLDVDSSNAPAAELMMGAFLAEKNYAEASQLAEQWIKHGPEQGLGYFFRGMVESARNRAEQAVASFATALEKSPGAVEPLTALVRTALTAKKPQLAQKHLGSIIKSQPDNVIAHNLRGEVRLAEKDARGAIGDFERAIEINAGLWIPYRNLALAHLQLKQQDKAIDAYRRGIAAARQNDMLVLDLARLFEQRGDIDAAHSLYEDKLKQQPRSAMAANNLALLLVNHHDDQASKDRALALVDSFQASDNAVLLDTLGWVHYKRSELDLALNVLLQAQKLNADGLLIHYHLGAVYFSKGDQDQARHYLEAVLKTEVPFRGRDDARRMLDSLNQPVALSRN